MEPKDGARIRAAAESGSVPLAVLAESRTRLANGDEVAAAESDVALALSLLKRAKTATVSDAVEAIGRREARDAADGLEVFDPLVDRGSGGLAADRVRLHAVAVRDLAAELARAIGYEEAEALQSAALLHDIGKAVIAGVVPDYADQVPLGTQTPDERLRAEREAFGIDHAEAGAILLNACGLPERIVLAVRHHHVGGHDSVPDAPLLSVANMLAHYRSGQPIDTVTLAESAAAVGVRRDEIAALLYDLAAPLARAPAPSEPCPLSPGELAVVKGLARGLLYKQIAAELGVSPHTVRNQIHRAYAKLGTRDRAQVVLIAHDRGWL
jgi:putative nucleotidyltransferase with HDIG domain